MIGFSLLSNGVEAAVSDFVITEIMYDPGGSDTGKEWVEVYNTASQSATIVGGAVSNSLRFFDGSNHTFAVTAFQGSMTVDPQTYFVIAQKTSSFNLSYPNYRGALIEISAMSLENTSESIGFRLGSSGSLFSNFIYDKSWGGAGTGKTLEKKIITGANDSSNWVEGSVDGGTPGEPYQDSLPVVYPASIRINEFLPDPESGEEWVEIFNFGEQPANLNSWQLDDIDGGSGPQSFSVTLEPFSYFVIYFSSSKLNNDGDTVRLLRPDGFVVDSINYSSSNKGSSWDYEGKSFVESLTPTLGALNQIKGKEKSKDRIFELKRLPLGSEVELEAYVSVPENVFGKDEFYVWDKEAGIRISFSQPLSQPLAVGDKVLVASTIEESYQERYIKTDAIQIMQKGAINIEERKILTGEVSEPVEGLLIKVVGKLVEQEGDTFYLDDGSGKAKVYLKDSTGIVKPKMVIDEVISAIGLVSQYGFLKGGQANYRILPRFQSDVSNLGKDEITSGSVLGIATDLKELPETGSSDLYTLGWTLIFLGLGIRLALQSQANVF